jgi:hypothetical protein
VADELIDVCSFLYRLRDERIKRNQQYLAELGLEGNNGFAPVNKKKRRRKSAPPVIPSEQRTSSRSKKAINYTEMPNRWLTLTPEEREAQTNSRKAKSGDDSQKPRSASQRMDKYVYLEFKRVRTTRLQAVKQAKRDIRAAEREVKHWQRPADAFEKLELQRLELEKRMEQRRLEMERLTKNAEEERKILGCTKLELLQEIDRRSYELSQVVFRHEGRQKVSIALVKCTLQCMCADCLSNSLHITVPLLGKRHDYTAESPKARIGA